MALSGIDTTRRNEGLLDLQADQCIRAFANGIVLDNAGVLRKSAGEGVSRFETALINNGTIEALTGTLELPANWVNQGQLRGDAALRSNTLSNAGSIAPGLPGGGAERIATLTLQGNLLQADCYSSWAAARRTCRPSAAVSAWTAACCSAI